MLLSSQAFGQQTHFIYLQTENREPFYVLLKKKTISSSAIGFMIIPKLENGEHNIRIGFAKNAGEEQDYVLQVKDNEQGYLIKNFGDKGWALFNLQSLELQYAGAINKQRISTAMLAAEANLKADEQAAENRRKAEALVAAEAKLKVDTEKAETEKLAAEKLKQAEIVVPEKTPEVAPKEIPATILVPKDVTINKVIDSILPKKTSPIANEQQATNTLVTQNEVETDSKLIGQIQTDSGLIYKYAVNNKGSYDTVNVFIKGVPQLVIEQPKDTLLKYPLSKDTLLKDSLTKDTLLKDTILKDTITTQPNAIKDSVKFLNMDFAQDSAKQHPELIVPVFKNPTPPEYTDTTRKAKMEVVKTQPEKGMPGLEVKNDSLKVVTAVTTTLPNSNCRADADEKDFFNLRKKMAGEETADEMVVLAKKAMKEKCYSTTQVRNLSVLFLNDADRYQFLDMAYPFTSDAYQYETLLNLLNDTYYVQRFKAMIRK